LPWQDSFVHRFVQSVLAALKASVGRCPYVVPDRPATNAEKQLSPGYGLDDIPANSFDQPPGYQEFSAKQVDRPERFPWCCRPQSQHDPEVGPISLRQFSSENACEDAVHVLRHQPWSLREPSEQARLLGLLIQRVDYDGGDNGEGKLAITLLPDGLQRLAKQLTGERT
jgi:hypothetical protein